MDFKGIFTLLPYIFEHFFFFLVHYYIWALRCILNFISQISYKLISLDHIYILIMCNLRFKSSNFKILRMKKSPYRWATFVSAM